MRITWLICVLTTTSLFGECQISPDKRILESEIGTICSDLLKRPNSSVIAYSFNKAVILLRLDSTGKKVIDIQLAYTLKPASSEMLDQQPDSLKRRLSRISFSSLMGVPLSNLKNADLVVEGIHFDNLLKKKIQNEECVGRKELDAYYSHFRQLCKGAFLLPPLIIYSDDPVK